MIIEYEGATGIKGSLLAFETVENVSYGEKVYVRWKDKKLPGRVVELGEKVTLIEILGETEGIEVNAIHVRFTGKPFKIPVSERMLGRIFNAFGEPADKLGSIVSSREEDINGKAINPAWRNFPNEFVHTGISAIDGLNTLVRGQKLPIFAVSGVPTDKLVAQLVRQIKIPGDNNKNAIVLGLIGIKYEIASSLIENIKGSGNFSQTAVFMSLANESCVNNVLVPRAALTLSEFLAFEKGYDVVTILYDMTNYCDALREMSSRRDEIPGRKGYPGYMYSDLATIYERAGLIKGRKGSLTQIPVLTMPDDDITHPIPDLTGYITEGQIVLDRGLFKKGIYPPINVLPSLSRLMNQGITKLQRRWANQIYSAYARSKRVEMLAAIIGESELSDTDRKFLEFGRAFEKKFLTQSETEDRTLEETIKIGWQLLSILPKTELTRLTEEDIAEHIR
ncbi:V-type ATP synthase subunit B [Desulfurobacterium indicum]|uniref:V-type ATP synthase beta chain n=1 Tax=Desulfurobacterium indicum TaxID=1914305 RepID=A0A1R1MLQ4_9BACT|nr:V-type ATP synthase subunit B [Desulfurobacterium indicum]OMH40745.1 V-type ATP synthase subunit B [Desulfurobacterium indicum]